MTPGDILQRLLQEISVAECEPEIAEIVERYREQLNCVLEDAVRERLACLEDTD
jgi:hypothetical protein